MAGIITISCPSCGAKLAPTQDADTLSCIHCGNRYTVTQEAGLGRVEAAIESVGEILGGIAGTKFSPETSRAGDRLATLLTERDAIQARLTSLKEEKATSVSRRRARWILFISGPATAVLLCATIGLLWVASARWGSETAACPALIAGLLLAVAGVVSALASRTLISTTKSRPMADLEQAIRSSEQGLQRTVEAIEQVGGRPPGGRGVGGPPE